MKVNIAQCRIAKSPARLMTMALGSCLGITLYDAVACVGALAHVMHPKRGRVRNNISRAKFVDTAIEMMIDGMLKRRASNSCIVAKIFGGARMFNNVVGSRSLIQIGEDNVAEARVRLKEANIPIVAESVGGSKGRTIIFDLSDGSVHLRDAHNREAVY